jgi:hypothetical protein
MGRAHPLWVLVRSGDKILGALAQGGLDDPHEANRVTAEVLPTLQEPICAFLVTNDEPESLSLAGSSSWGGDSRCHP